jgi:hypothetical protein
LHVLADEGPAFTRKLLDAGASFRVRRITVEPAT